MYQKKDKIFLSEGVRSCQEWHVYRLFYFENKGYVLSIFDMKTNTKEEDEYKRRYIESSKPPEAIKKDSEVFKELEKHLDIDIEKYYKTYTDIEYKSEWDSPKEKVHALLDDLVYCVKYNKAPDINNESELNQIIEEGFKIYIPTEKVKEQYEEAENKFYETINTLKEDINKLHYIQQYYPNKLQSQPIKHSIEAIKIIEVDTNLKNNPLYQLYKTSNKHIERLASLQVEEEFNIKRTVINGQLDYYYLNDEGFYEEINDIKLTSLIKNKFNLNFDIDTAARLLKGVVNDYEVNTDYIIAKNGLINKTNGKLETDKNLKNILCIDNLGIKKSNNLVLLEYKENAEPFNTNETLVEKTLKEICIPKNNEDYTKIYIDRLERFGANILDKHNNKSIAFYYTQRGNSGKSALRSLTSLLINDNAAVINANDLEGNFNYNQIGNKKAILIDETKKGQLEEVIDKINLISSPDPRRDYKKIHGDETVTVESFGNLEIFTNHPIKLNIDEDALFYRIDVIQLPNTFVTNKNELKTKENAYLLNNNLFDGIKLIENDIEGLSWLASVSIQECLKMGQYNKTFACRQTEEETRNILLNVDQLKSFIARYTEPDEENFTTNKKISICYQQYLKLKGLSITEEENKKLPANIGYKIKELYGEELRVKDPYGIKYRLRLKKIGEVEIEFKQVWVTNEDNLTDNQIEMLSNLHGDIKEIFRAIKKGEYNTINKLLNQYPNIRVFEHVKDLERLGLIYNTFNLHID